MHDVERRAGDLRERDGTAVGLLHPDIERFTQRLAFVLDGEIHERGRAAPGGSTRAGLEIIGAPGTAEGHVEMRVDINAAGEDVAVFGVDQLLRVVAWQ